MVNAGRALIRALIVIGGAAAVSAVAWLMATASASTLTDAVDEPIASGVQAVVSATGGPTSSVLPHSDAAERIDEAATPVLAHVRSLSEAAGTSRLTDVLDTHAIRTVTAVPATVLTLGHLTDLAGILAPVGSPLEYVGKTPVASATTEPNDFLPASAKTDPRGTSAGSAVATLRHAATTSTGVQAHADLGPDSGAGEDGGRSGLQGCAVPAGAGFAAGHDRGCGDVVQPRPEARLQSSRCWNRVLSHAVTAAEIQPGVTPD
ncbi:hypothetical protein [Amycolatopsis sp. lyj-23]|uniref:hypothetical protein n=1 Tax=Amycolatopsis sp. lyj-23 TaxID=2789283 RepID=UPI00397D744B